LGTGPISAATSRCSVPVHIGTGTVTGGSAIKIGSSPQYIIATKLTVGSIYASPTGVVGIVVSAVIIIISVIRAIIVGRIVIRTVIASPSVGISITRITIVTVIAPTPRVVITVISTIISTVERTRPTVVVTAPSIVIDINAHIGRVVPPCGISVIIIIAIIVIYIRVYLQAIVFHVSIITIYIGKHFTFQDLAVFIGFLSKIIAIVILFGLNLTFSGPLVYLHPFGPVRIYTVIIIGSRLIRSTGHRK